MSELNNKVLKCFGEYAVDKRLAYELELGKLPRFVAEYLIAAFMGQGGDWKGRLINFVKSHYYGPEERELVKHKLVMGEAVELIDELKVYVDVASNVHIGEIQTLGLRALVPVDIVDKNRALLTTGLWGLIKLVRTSGADEWELGGILVTDFKPFQAHDADVEVLREARRCFNLDEWVDVLINTVGLDPAVYSPRQKLLLISRLIPLVEGNVNMMEFGPRQTGKTYLYRNVSSYARIISGGNISPATLFYNLRTKVPGELAVRDLVVFDEVSKVRFSNPDEMMGKLKDYMESGHFERGDKRAVSDASLMFMGNVTVEMMQDGYVPVEDLTYVLPEAMRDSAFIDRVHGLIPGWELPKISQSKYHLSKGYGIASDYFSEYLHQARKESLSGVVRDMVKFSDNFKIRDEKAVTRLMSGLIKILFPHGEYDRKELARIAELALEYRQRVRDWLHKLDPGEFPKERLDIKISA